MKISLKTFLLFLLLALLWFFGFRLPMNRELADIAARTVALDTQIAEGAGPAAAMNAMEAALAASDPNGPAVAPYDNLEGVLAQLNAALEGTAEYSLRFSDPAAGKDGAVRRSVVLQFSCGSFEQAREILQQLTDGPWLCRIGGLTLRATDLRTGPLTASATITFYESTRIS